MRYFAIHGVSLTILIALLQGQSTETLFVLVRGSFETNIPIRRGTPPWAHDYPRAERQLLRAIASETDIEAAEDSHLVLALEDPRLLEHRVLYISEPGYWQATEAQASNLRKFLDRGGFIILDDFRGEHEWSQVESNFREVFPDRSFVDLPTDHPVFQSPYTIEDLGLMPPYNVPAEPVFRGLSDTEGRLKVIACFNTDLGDYWEWSGPVNPGEFSDKALMFGVNLVAYALNR